MQSKNASPLTIEEIGRIAKFLYFHPEAQLKDVAAMLRETGSDPRLGVPSLKVRALKAGYILRSRLSIDNLRKEGE